ncbi:hypothetical protein FSP39_004355 [Pinctada imbricata]|uniref:non-specific serine/threonine protein kinase n=1 Tax=Pinctada imbricata TaxID=66713 RepID=A0AA88Y8Z7_PINIB|nr:hypothetical protein FSP39_004355 [Pinctada imbricata]
MEDLEREADDNLVPNDRKKKVGSYILGKTIGEGSFAKVRLGYHIIAREKVAVKVVSKKALLLKEFVRRNVRREAIVLQKLSHPNVVRMYEVMETENSYYLVLEYAESGEFIKYLSIKKFLPEYECRKYIRQIVSAVDHMHKNNIVHRDLKLENFLLDKNLDIKIIDFGLSNVFYGDTSLSTQCGSPAYAAPEIFSNQKYGAGVDIWSLGVCMYAMLIGSLPFVPEPPTNIAQLHSLILKGCDIPEGLSEECRDLLRRMLSVEPRKRIKMEDIFRHPWILGENEEPIPRHNTLPHILATAPQAAVINYMTKMFHFKESDILSALGEKKVNAIAATYFLLQKRFEAGLHLVGLSVDMNTARRESAFSAFSIELSRRETRTAGKNTYDTSENLDSSRESRQENSKSAAGYRNYLQYLRESRERTNAFSKNIFLRRQKTRTSLTKQYRSENGSENKVHFDHNPDFRLTVAQNHAEVYEWESEGMLKRQPARTRPKYNEVTKERTKNSEKHVSNMVVTGELKLSHQVHLSPPPPLTPPNTSHGMRVVQSPVEEDEDEMVINDIPSPLDPPETQQLKSHTPSLPQTAPVRLNQKQGSKQLPPKIPIPDVGVDHEKGSKQDVAIVLADPCSQEIWGSFQKHKAKLIKGNTVTFSRSRTIYANPISSQKILTPRGFRPALDDINKAQVIGQGRLLIERVNKPMTPGSIDFSKPKTAITSRQREKLPEVVHSSSAKMARGGRSDLAEFERQCMTHLPDVTNPVKTIEEPIKQLVEIKSPPPLPPPPPPPVESPMPIERLIVEEEAPLMNMKIRITSKQ